VKRCEDLQLLLYQFLSGRSQVGVMRIVRSIETHICTLSAGAHIENLEKLASKSCRVPTEC
jgi:hypothetical protein